MFCREGSRSSPCPANSPAFALLPEIFLMKCPTANLVAWLFVATLAASDAAAQPRTVSIGTGSMSGVYQIAGEAICRLVNRDTPHHGVRCTIKGSGGSAHNLEALRQKTADMMVTDLIEGVYYENKEPGVFCVATDKPFPGTASFKVYMMNKDNQPLLEKVNRWLDSQDKNILKQKWKIHE